MILLIKYLLCVAGGVGLGYYIAHDHLSARHREELEREKENAKEFYRLKYEKKLKVDAGTNQGAEWPSEDPEFVQAAINAAEALEGYLGGPVDPVNLASEVTRVVEENENRDIADEVDTPDIPESLPETEIPVFDGEPVGLARRFEKPVQPAVDYAAMAKQYKETVVESFGDTGALKKDVGSSPGELTGMVLEKKLEGAHPAVEISMDDFVQNKTGYEQYSFTYFAGDDVLANESDERLGKSLRERIVSQAVMQKLKTGPEAMSGGTTLYIQNPEFNEGAGVEVEIEWSSGKYSDEVNRMG